MAEFEAHNLALPGDVVVIDGVAGISNMGGISAQTGKRQGEAGAIVFGGVRDVAHSRSVGYPVWSTEVTPVTGKWRIETVEINGEIEVAGVRVAPGDIVLADDTGVCFIPRARAAEVLELARKKAAAEEAKCRGHRCGHAGARFARQRVTERKLDTSPPGHQVARALSASMVLRRHWPRSACQSRTADASAQSFPDAAVENRGGFRAGRAGRCIGADRGANPVRGPGPAGDRGESPGRRRDDRRRRGREGGARWLHAAGRRHLRCHQPAHQQAKSQYNLETSFTPIALIASAPNVLVVHPSVPVGSVTGAGRLRQGPSGRRSTTVRPASGTVSHLAGAIVAVERRMCSSCTYPTREPRRRRSTCSAAGCSSCSTAWSAHLANAKAGKVKALAVTSPERWQSAPELPTMAESGFPGFDMTAWFGLLAPAGTPAPIVSRISEVLLEGSAEHRGARKRIAAIGAEPGHMTPAEFGRYIHAENARWKKLFADGLIRIEE